MFERLKGASRASADRGVPRKTTEVRIASDDDNAVVERAQTNEPALVLLEGDLPGQVFRLRVGRQIIGRRAECEIRVREKAMSGLHAEVIRARDSVTVNDLASTNGTIVNGVRIRTPVKLSQGALLKLGNCVFRYVDSLLEVEFTEALHARGVTDQLTGAFNKPYLVSRLGFAIDGASAAHPVSVIAFDFDDFKKVNDEFGHAAGDHILHATSRLIRESFVRENDLFARMGGEEFAIVLPDTPLETATRIAEDIRQRIQSTTFAYDQFEIGLTSSFGVAAATISAELPESLLERADELLYQSKREGRNRVTAL